MMGDAGEVAETAGGDAGEVTAVGGLRYGGVARNMEALYLGFQAEGPGLRV